MAPASEVVKSQIMSAMSDFELSLLDTNLSEMDLFYLPRKVIESNERRRQNSEI